MIRVEGDLYEVCTEEDWDSHLFSVTFRFRMGHGKNLNVRGKRKNGCSTEDIEEMIDKNVLVLTVDR